MHRNKRTHPNLGTLRALAVLVAALAAPATALAHVEPGTPARAQHDTPSALIRNNPLRDGKYLPQPTGAYGSAPAPTNNSPSGFDWADTGAGLGSAAFALTLLAGARVLIKRHRRETQPEQSSLAGA